MLDIGGVFARFIEDRISWTRVIARDADLYSKRFRHWSTTDPISILLWLSLARLALLFGGIYWRDEWRNKITIQNHKWSICDVVLTIVTILQAVQLCQMFCRASPSTAMLVVIALCNFPTAHAMEISKYNIIHCQVAWINHWLNKLDGSLHAPPRSIENNS